jgi:hypothetical protein
MWQACGPILVGVAGGDKRQKWLFVPPAEAGVFDALTSEFDLTKGNIGNVSLDDKKKKKNDADQKIKTIKNKKYFLSFNVPKAGC